MSWLSRTSSGLRPGAERIGSIGVDFSAERITFVQIAAAGSQFRLHAAMSVEHGGDLEAFLSSKAQMRRVFGDVLKRGRFRGRRVVTHAPAEQLRLMVLNYALHAGKSEPEQILNLARERMRDDLEDHVVDFVPIRTSGEQHGDRSALVAVVPEQPVVEHLDALRRGGLEVVALEIGPVALRRVVATTVLATSSNVVLVLRMGAETSELTLFSGRRLLLYREIEIGTDAIVEAVSKALDCELDAARELMTSFGVGLDSADGSFDLAFAEDPETFGSGADIAGTLRDVVRPKLRDLVEQAHKAISYAAFQTRGTSLDKFYLLEGSLPIPGLEVLLAEMMQIPVEALRPMAAIEGGSVDASPSSSQRLTMALGFSLRGLIDV